MLTIFLISDQTIWVWAGLSLKLNPSHCPNKLCFNVLWHIHVRFKTLNANSCRPYCAYKLTGSSLVQVMICLLIGASPLPEPMPTYCELDLWEYLSVQIKSWYHIFNSSNVLKKSSTKCPPLCFDLAVFTNQRAAVAAKSHNDSMSSNGIQ